MNSPSRQVRTVINGSDVASGDETGNIVYTSYVEADLPINAIIKWGRTFQIICFNQEKIYIYTREKFTSNKSDKQTTV